MFVLRTFQITAEQLKRLHVFAHEYVTAHDCPRCVSGLCESCQADVDLLGMVMEAVSLHTAGVDIVFTTQMHTAGKEGEGTIQ